MNKRIPILIFGLGAIGLLLLVGYLSSERAIDPPPVISNTREPAPEIKESYNEPEVWEVSEVPNSEAPKRDSFWGKLETDPWLLEWAQDGKSYQEIEREVVRRHGKEELFRFRWIARRHLKDFFDFPDFWEPEIKELPVLSEDLREMVVEMIVNRDWKTLKNKIETGIVPINARLRVNNSTTTFFHTINFGNEEVVDWFLARGIRPTGEDTRAATIKGDLSLLKKLAQAGGNLHHYQVPTLENNFIIAIRKNNLEMAEFLRNAGVSIRPDPIGFDALELTLRNKDPDPETIRYLKSLGF